MKTIKSVLSEVDVCPNLYERLKCIEKELEVRDFKEISKDDIPKIVTCTLNLSSYSLERDKRNGKGINTKHAYRSLMMEGVERYSYHLPNYKGEIVFNSYDELKDKCIHPNRVIRCIYESNEPISWVWGNLLSNNKRVLVPATAVFYLRELGRDNIIAFQTTTGLAAQTTHNFAVEWGVYECIERISYAKLITNEVKLISLDELSDDNKLLVEILSFYGRLDIFHYSELNVHSFIAIIEVKNKLGIYSLFAGSAAAHSCVDFALYKTLLSVYQNLMNEFEIIDKGSLTGLAFYNNEINERTVDLYRQKEVILLSTLKDFEFDVTQYDGVTVSISAFEDIPVHRTILFEKFTTYGSVARIINQNFL